MLIDNDRQTVLYLPGPLMLAILGALWKDNLTLRGLHAVLNRDYKPIALSTLSTTMTRLVHRGWVTRLRTSWYTTGISRDELKALVTEQIDQA